MPVRKDTVGVVSDSLQLYVLTQITQTASLQHSTPNEAAIAYECLCKIRGVQPDKELPNLCMTNGLSNTCTLLHMYM